MRSFFCELAN